MNKQENNKLETLDIPMCKGRDCPLTESCYRYTVDVSKCQSYFIESPFKNGRCELYWGDDIQGIYETIQKFKKK
jgi:hypothetical protein